MKRNLIALSLPFLVAGTVMASIQDTDQAWTARGAELLMPFKRNLKQALLSGLEQGPENAIAVCKIEAPEIARTLSTDGVVMGRTSHRLRNPANASPGWAQPLLDAYLGSESVREPVSVELPDQRVGYVEPILLQPLCVTCHGSSLAPEVASRIAAEYPDDEATGFEVGELRGIWWVEFPAPDSVDHRR